MAVEAQRAHGRALAEEYFAVFESAAESEAEAQKADEGSGGWQKIARIADAAPGDILAWKNPAHHEGDHANTGHVMIIDEVPVEEPALAGVARDSNRLYRVAIIDSSESPHADDTRSEGQTGVGRGTLWIVADGDGRPVGFHWKSAKGQGKDWPIAIGRAVRGER